MSLRSVSLLACLLLGAAPLLAQAQKHCLPYGPMKVTLFSKLERHAVDAAAVAEGASKVLALPTPVCVAASSAG